MYTLFHKKIDLLLFAKINFGKSLVFQLLLFMISKFNMVLILILLKLLLMKQNKLMNQIC